MKRLRMSLKTPRWAGGGAWEQWFLQSPHARFQGTRFQGDKARPIRMALRLSRRAGGGAWKHWSLESPGGKTQHPNDSKGSPLGWGLVHGNVGFSKARVANSKASGPKAKA